MSNLGLSIGAVHNLLNIDNRDFWIKYIRELNLNINAIELIFDPKTFNKLQLSKENIEWIKRLDYRSLHITPGFHCFDNWNINNYIYHPSWIMNNSYYKNNTLIENTDYEQDDKYFNILSNDFNICCDISHALSFSMDYLEAFIITHHTKIKQFHLSNYDKECHVPFYSAKYDRLNAIGKLLKSYNLLDLPFIIECNFKTELDLKNELVYVKNILWGE